MHQETGFANVNGIRLYDEVTGTGHPFVLLHGNTANLRQWDDQVEVFAPHYRVITYDMRGFGKSAQPTSERYTHYNDLRSVLEYLGVSHAYLLGGSAGGGVALEFALAFPEMIDALMLADAFLPGFHGAPEAPAVEWHDVQWNAKVATLAREVSIQAAMEAHFKNPMFEQLMKRPEVASRLVEMISTYSGWHWVHENPLVRLDPPPAARLADISMPTLVIGGEYSVPRFRAIFDTLATAIPHAKKVVIPGVGHMVNLEAIDQFNDTVLGFLTGL